MIDKLHITHCGVEATVRRARDTLFWVGMKNDIQQKIEQCDTCNQYQMRQQKEPMIQCDIPEYPW